MIKLNKIRKGENLYKKDLPTKEKKNDPDFCLIEFEFTIFSVIKGFYSNIKSSIFLKDELLFLYIG